MPATVTDSRSHVATDPLRNFRFQVNINHRAGSGSMAARLGFMTVSGLTAETQVMAYRQGGFNTTALPLDAPVLTASGWKRMGDIEVGDRVVDPRGEDSKVIGVYPAGNKDVYEVTLGDGSRAVACYGHLWEFQVRDTNNRKATRVASTLDMKAEVDRKGYQVLLPKVAPVEYEMAPDLPLDPYVLGVLISEGTFGESVTFASADDAIVERIRAALPAGHFLRRDASNSVKYAISVGNNGAGPRNTPGRNKVCAVIRDLGLTGHRSWQKFIPEPYLRASIWDRVELLRGILDGDGSVDTRSGSPRYSTASEQLAHDVRELINSLGGRVRLSHHTARTYRYNGVDTPCRDAWAFEGIAGIDFNPFSLTRKANLYRPPSEKTYSEYRRVVSVRAAGTDDVQCIEVSADSHLYVSHDFVPSHNTQKMPGQTDFSPLTLARGMMVARPDSWEWFTEIFAAIQGTGRANPKSGDNFRTTVDIFLLAHPWPKGNKVPIKARWKVYNAWIGSMSYSDLDAGGNAVAMEQMVLQHEGFATSYASDAFNTDAPKIKG